MATTYKSNIIFWKSRYYTQFRLFLISILYKSKEAYIAKQCFMYHRNHLLSLDTASSKFWHRAKTHSMASVYSHNLPGLDLASLLSGYQNAQIIACLNIPEM